MYISSWEIHTGSLRKCVAQAVKDGKAATNDIVWTGPSGDAIVAATAAHLNEEYADYTDAGLVEEYLH